MNSLFHLDGRFEPAGDQPTAIESIVKDLSTGSKHHLLMGVTGSGKTFTMANVIQRLGKPALILAPNKTLAAQLFTEFRELFPKDHVGFFVSYYDYFQPEAYVPSSDTYIQKDASINEDIDKMRHQATQDLFEKQNVIIVASVSCIYGLGSPDAYGSLVVNVRVGQEISRDTFLRSLIEIQYTRNDSLLERGSFRVRGETVDLLPASQKDQAIRVEFFGDEVEGISLIDALTGTRVSRIEEVSVFPNSHYVADRKDMRSIIQEILSDLGDRLRELQVQKKDIEFQRLEQRTMHDVESLEQVGFCSGIENYSRYLTGKKPGEAPPTLLDYFPEDFLTIIDESHITVPQIGGMYRGDRARKSTLVDFGFRLPSALDNRPLNFEEFLDRNRQVLYVSATPGPFEIKTCEERVTEQIIRPTGLIDPEIEIRPVKTQVDDLYAMIREVSKTGRILIITLTKKMAEDLAEYYRDLGVRVKYLHSDSDTLERADILRGLRKGDFDVLIGINLLREGLDLPEVELVAIMDADKEGFLRSRASLIQIVGRAARNVKAKVIFYADKITNSMQLAMDETSRRRDIQKNYNLKNNIEPLTIIKSLPEDLRVIYGLIDGKNVEEAIDLSERCKKLGIRTPRDAEKLIDKKKKEMLKAAQALDFENAARLRDEVRELKSIVMSLMSEDLGE
jgi:excinuclease ABC subunit B